MINDEFFPLPLIRIEQDKNGIKITTKQGEVLIEWSKKQLEDSKTEKDMTYYVQLAKRDPDLFLKKLGYQKITNNQKVFYIPDDISEPIISDVIFKVQGISSDSVDLINIKDPDKVYTDINLDKIEPFD